MKKIITLIASLLVITGVAMVMLNHNKVRAQGAQGFTVVAYDYYGCDPAAPAVTPCPPKFMYTRYVDPNLGTSTAGTVLNAPSQPTSVTVRKNDGTLLWTYPEIGGYYSYKVPKKAGVEAAPSQNLATCLSSNEVLLGVDTLLGFETYKYQTGTTTPGGDGSITSLAPSLNCAPLRTEFHFADGPTTYQVAAKVTLGAVPSAAFSPAVGTVEMAPLDLHHRLFVSRLKTNSPGTTTEIAETAWSKRMATDKGLVSLDAAWHRQHGMPAEKTP